jgi:hypothetical protein
VKFVLSVFENPDGVYATDNIAQSRPVWTTEVPGESSVNYVQYPVSGARALEPGTVYYWQVKAVLQGPVSREVTSGLYAFRVSDLDMAGTLSPTQNLILRYLAIILGSDYAYVMRDLRGMAPEETVTLDGRRIDIESLAKTAEEFLLGRRVVSHVAID